LIPGAPAELAGLKLGDLIRTIDGRSTDELTLIQITDLIRGQPATVVKLDIERETQRLKLNVKRKGLVVEADFRPISP
jgi:carboxyl-terminal processing protease